MRGRKLTFSSTVLMTLKRLEMLEMINFLALKQTLLVLRFSVLSRETSLEKITNKSNYLADNNNLDQK